MTERDPVRVGAVLAGMVARGGWRERLAAGRLRARWREVVGEQIAAHSEPIRLSDRTLLVRAESGPWSTELALLAPRLAGVVDAWLGGGLVNEVRVVAAGDAGRRRGGSPRG